jgi:hypothetical protein
MRNNAVGSTMVMNDEQRIKILMDELSNSKQGVRLYLTEMRKYIQLFAIIVLGAFGLAYTQHLPIAFVFIPILSLTLLWLYYQDVALVTVLLMRNRHIEQEIEEMNGGIPVLRWERLYANRFIYPLIIRLRNSDIPKEYVKTRRYINPLWISMPLISLVPYMASVFAVIEARVYFETENALVTYLVVMTVLHSVSAIATISFFRLLSTYASVHEIQGARDINSAEQTTLHFD